MSDVYVVLREGRIVGISARQQGAELIRADEAARQAEVEEKRYCAAADPAAFRDTLRQRAYDTMRIENHELQDSDDDA